MNDRVQDLSLFRLPADFRGRSALVCQAWWIIQDTLFRWSPQFMYGFRNALLRLFGAQIGTAVMIRPTVRIQFPWKVIIGDYTWIGDHAELYSLGPISIGAHAVISQMCYLCTATHDPSEVDFPIYATSMTVGDEVWLCAGVFIMPGANIGRGAVVGARSLVTKDIPAMALAKGNPAVVTGERKTNFGSSVNRPPLRAE